MTVVQRAGPDADSKNGALVGQGDLPLRAWPMRGGYSGRVPEIFGLDTYEYNIGARIADRARLRFARELHREQREVQAAAQALQVGSSDKLRPTAHVARPADSALVDKRKEGCSVDVGRAMRTVEGLCHSEPGSRGSGVILWSGTAQSSTDTTAVVRKRRQKLTDDLLKDMVMSYGDRFRIVAWWFSVFEFYCDEPDDVVLPALPKRCDDVDGCERGVEQSSGNYHTGGRGLKPNQNLLRKAMAPTTIVARASSAKGTRCNVDATAGSYRKRTDRARSAGALRDSTGRLPRPVLKRDGFGPPRTQRQDFSEALWARRKRELRKDRPVLACFGPSDQVGSLAEVCRAECLDEERLQAFMQSCSPTQRAIASAEREQRKSLADADNGSLYAGLMRWKKKEADAVRAPDGGSAACDSSSASDGDAMLDACGIQPDEDPAAACLSGVDLVSNNVRTDTSVGERQEADVAGETVMLRSASLALVDARMLRKRSSKRGLSQPTYDEAVREYARALKSVTPIQMSVGSLFQILSCLGVARRQAVERIYSHLQASSTSVTTLQESTHGLPFRTFYQLFREMRTEGGQAGHSSSWAVQINSALWKESVHMRRLLFVVLVDKIPKPASVTNATASAAARQEANDRTQVPFSLADLLGSLRLLLCEPVLLEFDKDSRLGGAAAAASLPADNDPAATASATAPRRSGLELSMLAEFMHAELQRAETIAEAKAVDQHCISFVGFERFVWQWPGVFENLMWLLMPLAARGAKFMDAEMRLKARQLSHRAGELRAQMDAQVRRLQKQHLECLHSQFTAPWHEAQRVDGSSPPRRKKCNFSRLPSAADDA